ncbi:MAG: hypothetical protein IJY39_03900 [Clostridia bacterium]|nr:hypothetical protein [Clostridia bacterium]
MKNSFKLIALFLALIMTLSVFVACDGGKEDETKEQQSNDAASNEATTEVEAEAKPDVAENNYGADFFLCIMTDSNSMDYHWVEESENDVLSEAIFARQEKVRDYLGVEVVGTKHTGSHTNYTEPFKTAVKNKDGSVDTLITHVYEGVPSLVSENYLADLASVPGINLEADYWNQEFMEDLSIGDKNFLGNNDFNILHTHVITFNKDMMDQYADSLEKSVYDLVRDYEWTIDQMIELANLVYIDQTADGKTPDDTFGISGRQWNEFPGFLHASNINIVEMDASGQYKVSLMNETNAAKTTELVDKLLNLSKSNGAWFDYMTTSVDTVPITTNRTLMHLGASTRLVGYLDYDINFGVLPYPLWDTAQKDVGYRHLQWGGYITVPAYVNNIQMVGETLEVLAFFSTDVKTAYYEKMLGKQVADVPDDSQMLAIIWDTVCCEFAQTYCQTLGGSQLLYMMATVTEANTSSNIASTVAGLERSANTSITKFMKKVEKASGIER